MSKRVSLAPWFLSGGILLAAIGLLIWFLLPISMFPPYVITALISIAYGLFCRRSFRAGAGKS